MALWHCNAAAFPFALGRDWRSLVALSSVSFYPRTILNYALTKPIRTKPLGSLSVWSMLFFISIQVATGLMSNDEISVQGLLAQYVSEMTSSLATSYHKHFGKAIIIALLCLHVASILFYWVVIKKNLVRSMITGNKRVRASHKTDSPSQQVQSSKDNFLQRTVGLVVFLLCASLVVYGVIRLG